MRKTFSCANKDVIVITIETCNKKTCSSTGNEESSSPAMEQEQQVQFLSDNDIDSPPMHEEGPIGYPEEVEPGSYKSLREEEPPPTRIYKLPVVAPRYHGPGCAIEVNILEKHADNCMFKKEDNDERNPAEDRVGSYECVGRMTFDTCPAPGQVQGHMQTRSRADGGGGGAMRRAMHNSRSRNRKERDHTVYFSIHSPPRPAEYVFKKSPELIKGDTKKHCTGECKLRIPIERNKRILGIKMKESLKTLMASSKSFPQPNDEASQVPSNFSASPALQTLEKRRVCNTVSPGTSSGAHDEPSEETIISISDLKDRDEAIKNDIDTKPRMPKLYKTKCKIIEVDLVSSKDHRKLAVKSSDDAIKLRSGKRRIRHVVE